MGDRRSHLLLAAAFALCLIAGSPSRIVGDGGEYLAQGLNFAALNAPSLGRQTIPEIERRVIELAPALADWTIEGATVAGNDRRRDFLHFWFYALLATPFIWITQAIGISPLHGFTALNLLLAIVAIGCALPRVGSAVVVLLFASPLVWWLDKAHTEVFTVTLLTITFVMMRDRPWWALVSAGMAATQNPPVAAVLLFVLGAEVWQRRAAVLSDRRLVAGASAGLALAALPPAYTYLKHGTPSLLLYATHPGLPTWREATAVVLDPSMGLVGNHPVFLLATVAAGVWLLLQHRQVLRTTPVIVAAATAVVFLYAFAQTTNPHHGATPSLSRYALWLIPLSLAVWMPVWDLAGSKSKRVVAGAALVSAVSSVFAFHPRVAEGAREPTTLASWLWERHPSWSNPLPEVFSETLRHAEGNSVPVATDNCRKVLLGPPLEDGRSVWPAPCLPADVPALCTAPGTLCYANRHGSTYDFVRAPGREVPVLRLDEAPWPAASESVVRRIYLDTGWTAMADAGPASLTVLRAQQDVRAVAFGTDAAFVIVLRATGTDATLFFRAPEALDGTIIDASTGEILATLAFEPPAERLWTVPVPSGTDGLVLLTMRQRETSE